MVREDVVIDTGFADTVCAVNTISYSTVLKTGVVVKGVALRTVGAYVWFETEGAVADGAIEGACV